MPLARVDQQHLTRSYVARLHAVVEVQAAAGHDDRDRDRVAVLGHRLAGLEAQADDAHRAAIGDLLEPERSRLVTHAHLDVNIIHATGMQGAEQARGVIVVIDVLRSFTVSAYALAGGARECRLVRTVAEARALAERTHGAVLCAEEDALPVEGIAISNSPTQIHSLDLRGKVLVQRSSAGTQVASELEGDDIFAASLVVAGATAKACLLRAPETVTLLASADHPEDHACAAFIEGLMRNQKPDLGRLLQALRDSERYRRAMSGAWPGFPPTDIELSLATDRFGFAMPISREEGYLRVTAMSV